jgi:hypothetical protein
MTTTQGVVESLQLLVYSYGIALASCKMNGIATKE